MKKQLGFLLAAGLLTAATAVGQGTLNFNTLVGPSANRTVNAPVRDQNGALIGGAAGWAQLWGGPNAASLQPLGSPINFRSAGFEGYLSQTTAIVVPTVAPGAVGVFELRAWSASSGSSWAAANVPGGAVGSKQFSQATGGVIDPGTGLPGAPANLTGLGLTGFSLSVVPIPEPSTIALGLLGAAALFLRRRK